MRYSAVWDGIGAGLSGLCVVHCLVLPLLLVVAPSSSLLVDESVQQALVVLLSIPALFAFVPGYRLHQRRRPAALGFAGLALLALGAFGASETHETFLTVVGSVLLVAAHGTNSSFCRLCALARGVPGSQRSRHADGGITHALGLCDCENEGGDDK